jgi:hypothetical protein
VNELVNHVAEKVGITTDQARSAVETVMGYCKSRLPESIHGHLDGLFGGAEGAEGSEGGLINRIKDGVGSLIGSKK